MNTPKILLHLGLPKTATSSLQQNVLQRLHEEERINFLGKYLQQNYKTGKVQIFNYSGRFIRQAAEGTLSIESAREQLVSTLSLSRLNVFSDEGLMVAYPNKKNLGLSEKFENLTKIFDGYDVRVVVTLRDPVDYLYSLYVQLYPDICSKVKEVDSVQKYVELLLAKPQDVLFESFFFDRWLANLTNKFDVTIFQYDQLTSKDEAVYEGWAQLLGMSTDEFKIYFDSEVVNVKAKSGKEVEKVRDLKAVEERLGFFLSKNQFVYNIAKWVYKKLRFNKILSYRFSSRAKHLYPKGEKYELLQKLLSR